MEGRIVTETESDGEAARTCRLCGGAVHHALRAHEFMFGSGEAFDYQGCDVCGSLQIAVIPSDLGRFYPDRYYAAPSPVAESANVGRKRPRGPAFRSGGAIRRSWSRLRLRRGGPWRLLSGRRYARFDWLRMTNTQPDDTVLDVGCGNGRLLSNLARDGYHDLVGIDPAWSGEARPTHGVRFECATPAELEGTYRLVMAHHSFEHMRDPRAAFAAMARLVAPGGSLLLRVPLAEGWAFEYYGEHWVQLDAPRHLFVPTRRAIDGLARAHGLELRHVVDDSGPFQIWGSEIYRRGYALDEAGRGGRRVLPLHDRMRARRQARRLSEEGKGDQACFYLRRPDQPARQVDPADTSSPAVRASRQLPA